MSFGEGDLHAAVERLEARVGYLERVNGALCDTVNRQYDAIRELKRRLAEKEDTWTSRRS